MSLHRDRAIIQSLFLLVALSMPWGCGRSSRDVKRVTRPNAARPTAASRPARTTIEERFEALLKKIEGPTKGKGEVDVGAALKGVVPVIPKPCRNKGEVQIIEAPTDGAAPPLERGHPGALLLIVPEGYEQCPERDGDSGARPRPSTQRAPSLCAVSVVLGKDGQRVIMASSPMVELGGEDAEVTAGWSQRPKGKLLLTLRYKRSKKDCKDPSEEGDTTESLVELIRYSKGHFTTLGSSVSSATYQSDSFSRTKRANEQSWHRVGKPPIDVLVLTSVNSMWRRTPDGGGDLKESGSCSRRTTLLVFSPDGSKLVAPRKALEQRLRSLPELRDELPKDKEEESEEGCDN